MNPWLSTRFVGSSRLRLGLLCLLLLQVVTPTLAFVATPQRCVSSPRTRSLSAATGKSKTAQDYLEQARRLREEIAVSEQSVKRPSASTSETKTTIQAPPPSPWSLPVVVHDNDENEAPGAAYRLDVDLGREPGTWMEPRWGASGTRLEFTLDVRFSPAAVVNRTVTNQMVKDNLMGKAGPVCRLETASWGRMRSGFDRIQCLAGAYRIDRSSNGQATLRLFFTAPQGKQVGDVILEEACNLYISLPLLPGGKLSRKEGIVSVRQYGWKTGWYREESRIVGVVRARALADAQAKDKF
jgi:hypothetical protein